MWDIDQNGNAVNRKDKTLSFSYDRIYGPYDYIFYAYVDDENSMITFTYTSDFEVDVIRKYSKIPKNGIRVLKGTNTALFLLDGRKRIYSYDLDYHFTDLSSFIPLTVQGDVLEFSEIPETNLLLVRTTQETVVVDNKGFEHNFFLIMI